MSDVSCAGCCAALAFGTPFCAQCGRPSAAAMPVPGGDPGSAAAPGHPPVHTGTTEPEVVGETRIPPTPPTAVPVGAAGPRYAHVGRRVLAYLLDGAVAGALAGLVYGIGFVSVEVPSGVVAADDPRVVAMVRHLVVAGVLGAALALAYWATTIVWEGRTGKTLGNLALGVRTVGADDGRPVGLGRALVRHLLLAVSGIVPVAGPVVLLLSPLWDAGGRSQGWHDKAVGAVVLDARGVATPLAAVPAPQAPPPPAPPAPSPRRPAAETTPSDASASTAAVPVTDGLITGVPEAAPAPAAAPAPSPPVPPSEVSELTSFETRMPRSQRQVLRPAPVAGVVLELESGAREPVDGLARIGRNPDATAGEDVRLVRVDDPSRSMSKNHADLGVDTGGLWLTDRGSTNGTVISVAGLPPRVAEPGARVRVPVGATVHLGDRRVVVHPGATA